MNNALIFSKGGDEMLRSRKIVLLSHCLLNANSKIRGTAIHGTVLLSVVEYFLQRDIGVIQLPCPEHSFSGESRWGQSKEQYNNPFYREHCQRLIKPLLAQLADYQEQGYQLVGILGIKGSPSCGVFHTFKAPWGGELGGEQNKDRLKQGKLAPESGIFMEILKDALIKGKLNISFFEVDEEDIHDTLTRLTNFISEDTSVA